jgi:hypothetical protein
MAETTKAPMVRALRARLEAERDRLLAELAPHRELYERLINAPELVGARAAIRRIGAELGPVQNELAALARAGGATGIQADPGVYAAGE